MNEVLYFFLLVLLNRFKKKKWPLSFLHATHLMENMLIQSLEQLQKTKLCCIGHANPFILKSASQSMYYVK